MAGFASHPDVLARAGTNDADMLIAATSMDEVNMVACQVAHSVFEVPTKIARVRSESYLSAEWSDLFRREHMPIDVVISPETEIAQVTMRRLISNAAFDIEPFLGERVSLVGLHLDDDCPVLNTPLAQLTELFSTLRAITVAVRRGGRLFAADRDDQLFAGDEIYVVAAREDLSRTFGIFGRENLTPERVVVVGAGNVGLRVAQRIEASPGLRARMIERDRPRAERAADTLERTIVLHGDALDLEMLSEAGVEDADAIIAVTERRPDQRALLRAGDPDGLPDLDRAVEGPDLPAHRRPARRHGAGQPAGDHGLGHPAPCAARQDPRRLLHRPRRGRDDRGAGHAHLADRGQALRDLNFPSGAIVGAVLRGDRLIMPNGDLTIQVGDSVVIFALFDAVKQVERMFRVSMDFF